MAKRGFQVRSRVVDRAPGGGLPNPDLAQKWPGPFLSKGPWSSEGEQHRSQHPDRDPPQARDLHESWEGPAVTGMDFLASPESRELGGYLLFGETEGK